MSRLNMETLAGYTFDRKARDHYQGSFLVRMLGMAFVASLLFSFFGLIAGMGLAFVSPALVVAIVLGIGGWLRNRSMRIECTSCGLEMERSHHSPPIKHFQHLRGAHGLILGTDRGSGAVYMQDRDPSREYGADPLNTYQISAEYYLCHECQRYFLTGQLDQKRIGSRSALRNRLDHHAAMKTRPRVLRDRSAPPAIRPMLAR